MPDAGAQLEAGGVAAEAGEWAAAREAFAAALGAEESADALLGLGDAEWWLEDVEASRCCHRERAYALLRRADPLRAAMVGMGLCINYGASLGNHAAARGWLGRVARLVEEARLERALTAFARLEMPLEGARARLLLARALAPTEAEAAIAEARAALQVSRRTGPLEPRDRRAPRRLAEDRGEPRLARAVQARPHRPRAGRGVCGPSHDALSGRR